jgi:hypothetical protein
VILFVYLQFKGLDDFVGNVPFMGDIVQTTKDRRKGLDGDAFQVGQVNTVKASDTELTLPNLFQKVEKLVGRSDN